MRKRTTCLTNLTLFTIVSLATSAYALVSPSWVVAGLSAVTTAGR
jgi:hypothetical protein